MSAEVSLKKYWKITQAKIMQNNKTVFFWKNMIDKFLVFFINEGHVFQTSSIQLKILKKMFTMFFSKKKDPFFNTNFFWIIQIYYIKLSISNKWLLGITVDVFILYSDSLDFLICLQHIHAWNWAKSLPK